MKLSFDSYVLQARLLPVFIVFVPIGLVFLAWFPVVSVWEGVLGTFAIPTILTGLFSQLGRDQGKKKESSLFLAWDGMPTDRILFSSRTFLDSTTLARYKAKLVSLVPGVQLYDSAGEERDREGALRSYRSFANFLREQTRDQGKFPLVFAENTNYGFRRNLWAMKPAGMLIAALGVLGSLGLLFLPGYTVNYPVLIAAVLINVMLFVFWIFRITPNWVRVPAEEYAKQLFAACEIL